MSCKSNDGLLIIKTKSLIPYCWIWMEGIGS